MKARRHCAGIRKNRLGDILREMGVANCRNAAT